MGPGQWVQPEYPDTSPSQEKENNQELTVHVTYTTNPEDAQRKASAGGRNQACRQADKKRV
ncbi:hypothetical protein [Nitrospira sp. Nam74]